MNTIHEQSILNKFLDELHYYAALYPAKSPAGLMHAIAATGCEIEDVAYYIAACKFHGYPAAFDERRHNITLKSSGVVYETEDGGRVCFEPGGVIIYRRGGFSEVISKNYAAQWLRNYINNKLEVLK